MQDPEIGDIVAGQEAYPSSPFPLDPRFHIRELEDVRIISKRRIREFGMRFPRGAEPLKHWANAVNVGGHKYRLIAFVHYFRQIVYIKHILTHEKYDKGDGKL